MMSDDLDESERREEPGVRCFRCGKRYQADQVGVAQGDAYPAQFRGQRLCRICRELVKGKREGWWALPTQV